MRVVKHVRCIPDKYAEMSSPEESAALFRAYMGGARCGLGRRVGRAGIRPAMDPVARARHGRCRGGAEGKQADQDGEHSDDGGVIQAVGVFTSERRDLRAWLMSSSTSSKLPVVSLMAFNQAAAQRKIQVEYLDEWVDGKWVVSCVLNGIKKGSGSGQNKRTAKEEAVRDAHAQLGWYL
ncbi:unnamed protein product [Mycena citricolor]|uniref:DRBM domain-containing protein n=1 Tax=Mycena citricolor TaxID=2018698 RepID=A0AAD2JVQ8_9AGAR|nr:unnamed protein product [Mycena citricolor]